MTDCTHEYPPRALRWSERLAGWLDSARGARQHRAFRRAADRLRATSPHLLRDIGLEDF